MCESAWNQKPFSIYGDQYDTKDGTVACDYIHVCDIARAHQSALKINSIHGINRYILSSGRPVSVKDVLEQFQTSNQLMIDAQVSGTRAGDISECAGNSEKAQVELGWEVVHTLDEICKDAWMFKRKIQMDIEKNKEIVKHEFKEENALFALFACVMIGVIVITVKVFFFQLRSKRKCFRKRIFQFN